MKSRTWSTCYFSALSFWTIFLQAAAFPLMRWTLKPAGRVHASHRFAWIMKAIRGCLAKIFKATVKINELYLSVTSKLSLLHSPSKQPSLFQPHLWAISRCAASFPHSPMPCMLLYLTVYRKGSGEICFWNYKLAHNKFMVTLVQERATQTTWVGITQTVYAVCSQSSCCLDRLQRLKPLRLSLQCITIQFYFMRRWFKIEMWLYGSWTFVLQCIRNCSAGASSKV